MTVKDVCNDIVGTGMFIVYRHSPAIEVNDQLTRAKYI